MMGRDCVRPCLPCTPRCVSENVVFISEEERVLRPVWIIPRFGEFKPPDVIIFGVPAKGRAKMVGDVFDESIIVVSLRRRPPALIQICDLEARVILITVAGKRCDRAGIEFFYSPPRA